MGHEGGRIFKDVNSGVDISDIQAVMGLPYSDLGALIQAKDANNNYIVNPFSKKKPFRQASFTPTDAQRLAALFGTSIPDLGILTYKTRYADKWTFVPPRGKGAGTNGYNEWFRRLDFDGYQHNRWPETVGANSLLTIFDGVLSVPSSIIAPGDLISFEMQCRENDDFDANLGLLYPYDFAGADSPYDLSHYYLGIAIVDNASSTASQRHVWIISGPQVSDYFNLVGYHVRASMYANVPDVPFGSIIIAPVLLQNNTVQSGASTPSWTTNYQGTIIGLNGAHLSLQSRQAGDSIHSSVTCVSLDSTSITMEFSITNNTGDLITVSNMVAYLLSDASEMNEHSSTMGYEGIDYRAPSAGNYIQSLWPQYVQGDIKNSTRWDAAANPDELCARFIYDTIVGDNVFQAFKEANNGDNRIGNGHTVTFQVTMARDMVLHGHVGDDFGPYSEGAWVYWGIHALNNAIIAMRPYQIITI